MRYDKGIPRSLEKGRKGGPLASLAARLSTTHSVAFRRPSPCSDPPDRQRQSRAWLCAASNRSTLVSRSLSSQAVGRLLVEVRALRFSGSAAQAACRSASATPRTTPWTGSWTSSASTSPTRRALHPSAHVADAESADAGCDSTYPALSRALTLERLGGSEKGVASKIALEGARLVSSTHVATGGARPGPNQANLVLQPELTAHPSRLRTPRHVRRVRRCPWRGKMAL